VQPSKIVHYLTGDNLTQCLSITPCLINCNIKIPGTGASCWVSEVSSALDVAAKVAELAA